jgi:hypothetical protein
VTVGVGPEYVPDAPQPRSAEPEYVEQWPVMAGLEAEVDDLDKIRRLDHPQGLVGERPAKGSDELPA